MDLPIFQIDAFTRDNATLFSGNPAAVIPLNAWLTEEQMQAIAAENNLSETTFFVRSDDTYTLRWFTPTNEVDLCGHATLATAHVIHQVLGDQRTTLPMQCGVGPISVDVINDGEEYALTFPRRMPDAVSGKRLKNKLSKLLGQPVVELYESRDLIAVLENEAAVRECQPDFAGLQTLEHFALAITAPAESPERDFVSRFFAPRQGIDEDPVTGSSFCSLAPLWQQKLDKAVLSAEQCSVRGGHVSLTCLEDSVRIAGTTFHYMQGVIRLPLAER